SGGILSDLLLIKSVTCCAVRIFSSWFNSPVKPAILVNNVSTDAGCASSVKGSAFFPVTICVVAAISFQQVRSCSCALICFYDLYFRWFLLVKINLQRFLFRESSKERQCCRYRVQWYFFRGRYCLVRVYGSISMFWRNAFTNVGCSCAAAGSGFCITKLAQFGAWYESLQGGRLPLLLDLWFIISFAVFQNGHPIVNFVWGIAKRITSNS
ncbi:MAG: hypothetical protein EZS28_047277, partial [Streblomastix strix]